MNEVDPFCSVCLLHGSISLHWRLPLCFFNGQARANSEGRDILGHAAGAKANHLSVLSDLTFYQWSSCEKGSASVVSA